MKIYTCGLEIQPGKYKYKGEYFDKLIEKFAAEKNVPFSVEFSDSESEQAEAVVFKNDTKLDLIVGDLEKIETRMQRSDDERERLLLTKCQQLLEQEALLCDGGLSDDEYSSLKTLSLVTLKSCLGKDEASNVNEIIQDVLIKAKIILFFTVCKKEVRAWSVPEGETVLEAAGKIHSDMKRGFIKAEVVNCRDLDNFYNLAEARSRGLVKVVGREYIVQANDIIEIRFNV